MYTQMFYEAERTRTAQEWRELNTRNGELARAIRRPFELLRPRLSSARHAAPLRPQRYAQPCLETRRFPEATASVARCN